MCSPLLGEEAGLLPVSSDPTGQGSGILLGKAAIRICRNFISEKNLHTHTAHTEASVPAICYTCKLGYETMKSKNDKSLIRNRRPRWSSVFLKSLVGLGIPEE